MKLIDLSAPIRPDPEEYPDPLRTEIEFADHAAGAEAIQTLFGVGPELLRDGESLSEEDVADRVPREPRERDIVLVHTGRDAYIDEPDYAQIERLVGLDKLPLQGFEVVCFPLRLVGGGAAPPRVVAVVPD